MWSKVKNISTKMSPACEPCQGISYTLSDTDAPGSGRNTANIEEITANSLQRRLSVDTMEHGDDVIEKLGDLVAALERQDGDELKTNNSTGDSARVLKRVDSVTNNNHFIKHFM